MNLVIDKIIKNRPEKIKYVYFNEAILKLPNPIDEVRQEITNLSEMFNSSKIEITNNMNELIEKFKLLSDNIDELNKKFK